MKFIILCMISLPVLALVYGDKMTGRVLKAYNENYLVLNRGLEDGIFKNEHVKITNEQGYVSRAICVKPRMMISHCKVYRVVNPQLLSLDNEYTISSIKQSEIPDDLKRLKDIDYSNRYNDFTDKDVNKALKAQNERIVNFDLVNDFKRETLAPRDSATKTQALLDKNFNKKKLDKDLKELKVKLFASPLSFQKQGGQYSQDLGIEIANNGTKYDFSLAYFSRKNKVANQYIDTSITQETSSFEAGFELKDFSDDTSAISFVKIKSQEFDGIKTPMNSTKIGPIGAKYYLSQKDDFKSFFSYVPFFEKTRLDSVLKDRTIEKNLIRHRLVLKVQKALTKNIDLNFNADLQPELTFNELSTFIDLGLDLKMTKNLSLSYTLNFISNSLIEDNYQLENTDLINSINFNYAFVL